MTPWLPTAATQALLESVQVPTMEQESQINSSRDAVTAMFNINFKKLTENIKNN